MSGQFRGRPRWPAPLADPPIAPQPTHTRLRRAGVSVRIKAPAARGRLRTASRGRHADRPFDEPATSTARRIAAATWVMSSTTVASRAYRWCPRGGRDGHAAHLEQVALRQQVQRDIERRQAVAPRAARTQNLYRAGGRIRVTFVPRTAPSTDTAGVLGRTGSLSRAALVVMFLQELAYQLLAPPAQLPFEFALAHLSGFAGGDPKALASATTASAAAPGRSIGGRGGRRFAALARRLYVLSPQPSQVSLPKTP